MLRNLLRKLHLDNKKEETIALQEKISDQIDLLEMMIEEDHQEVIVEDHQEMTEVRQETTEDHQGIENKEVVGRIVPIMQNQVIVLLLLLKKKVLYLT